MSAPEPECSSGFASVSRPVRPASTVVHLEESSRIGAERGSGTSPSAALNVPATFAHLLGLLGETDRLVDEVQSVMRRIGVELERLGVSPLSLPDASRPLACPELDSLSPRESEIVQLFLEGHRVSTIARSLFISQHTVRNHLHAVYRKIGVCSQAELIEKLKGRARPVAPSTESSHYG